MAHCTSYADVYFGLNAMTVHAGSYLFSLLFCKGLPEPFLLDISYISLTTTFLLFPSKVCHLLLPGAFTLTRFLHYNM